MIRTLAWKEYREHRAVWAVMTIFALGVLGALTFFRRSIGWEVWSSGSAAIGFMLTAMYGVICAAMVLAGERESGTLGFLDSLSASRTPLWRTKFWLGAILTMANALVIGLVLIFNGFHWWLASSFQSGPHQYSIGGAWLWGIDLVVVLIVFAVAAYAWSLLLSSLCRTVLGAVGYAVLSLCLVCALSLGLAITVEVLLRPGPGFPGVLVFMAAFGAVGSFSSWWIYARQDTERESTGVAIPRGITLLWLLIRQVRGKMVPLAVSAIILGCLVPWLTWFGWPVIVALVGVCCGIATFAGEQASGWRRFLGDQRLPPIWIWMAKILFWLGIAVLLTGLMALSAYACVKVAERVISSEHSRLYEYAGEDWQGWSAIEWYSSTPQGPMAVVYGPGPLAFWLAYGFSLGLISVLIVRKTIVAVLIGLLLSGFFLALWFPSLTAGGVYGWQLYGLPVLCLAFSYLLMRAWMSDRIYEGRALLGVIGGGVLAMLWMAGNFCYRAFEFPDLPPAFDVAAYKSTMPAGEAAETGRLIVEAVHGFVEQSKVAREQAGPLTESPFPEAGREGASYSYIAQFRHALESGWPVAKADKLNRWLDVVCQGKWLGQIRAAASLPLGVVNDPALAHRSTAHQQQLRYQDVAAVLAARALQLASRGQNRAALDHLGWILGLSRNLRHRATTSVYALGGNVETTALSALYQWLNHPGLEAANLRRALAELRVHEKEIPPLDEAKEADYVLAMETLKDPGRLATGETYYLGGPLAVDAAILTASVPWERERFRRLLNFVYANRHVSVPAYTLNPLMVAYYDSRRLLDLFGLPPFRVFGRSEYELKIRRVSELMIAMVLYEAENHGRPAPSLTSLVPRYLSEIPRDPSSGSPSQPEQQQPFGYFVSQDGWLLVNRGLTEDRDLTHVAAGRGVIAPASIGEAGCYLVPAWRPSK